MLAYCQEKRTEQMSTAEKRITTTNKICVKKKKKSNATVKKTMISLQRKKFRERDGERARSMGKKREKLNVPVIKLIKRRFFFSFLGY